MAEYGKLYKGYSLRQLVFRLFLVFLIARTPHISFGERTISLSSDGIVEVLIADDVTIQLQVDCNFACFQNFDFYISNAKSTSSYECRINFSVKDNLNFEDCTNERKRIEMAFKSNQGNRRLIITTFYDSIPQDGGNYSLKFSSNGNTAVAFVNVKVLVPPNNVELYMDSMLLLHGDIVRVQATQTYLFSCSIDGNGTHPLTDLTWSYSESMLQDKKSQFFYTILDNGYLLKMTTYLNLTIHLDMNSSIIGCSASHKGLNSTLFKEFELRVYEPPSKVEIKINGSLVESNSVITIQRGENVGILCTSYATTQDVTLHWMINDQPATVATTVTKETFTTHGHLLFDIHSALQSSLIEKDLSNATLTCVAVGLDVTLTQTVFLSVEAKSDAKETDSDNNVYASTQIPQQEATLNLMNILPSAASLILTPIIAFVFFLVYKRCDKRQNRSAIQSRSLPKNPIVMTNEETNLVAFRHCRVDSSDDMYESILEEELIPASVNRMDRQNLHLITKIKPGFAEERWIASLHTPASKHMTVCVITLEKHSPPSQPWLREHFSKLLKLPIHENIVSYLFACEESDKYHLIQEYLSGGALLSLIQCETAMPIHEYITSIFQNGINAILNGIDFLHSNECSHPGLSVAKVLLSISGQWKLYDFCSTSSCPKKVQYLKDKVGSEKNPLPPETIQSNQYTTASDIWSAGIVMMELLTKDSPVKPELLHPLTQLETTKTESYLTSLYNICERCLSPNIHVRPSLLQLKDDVQNAVLEFKEMHGERKQFLLAATTPLQNTFLEKSTTATQEHNLPNDEPLYCHGLNVFQNQEENSESEADAKISQTYFQQRPPNT